MRMSFHRAKTGLSWRKLNICPESAEVHYLCWRRTTTKRMDKKNLLRDDMLEGVSGGTNLVLPEYMKAMTEEEVGEVLRDPAFVGTPEWEELMELNPQQRSKDPPTSSSTNQVIR
jgi:hypothetical protein